MTHPSPPALDYGVAGSKGETDIMARMRERENEVTGDVRRAAEEVASRLESRGIEVRATDSPDDLVNILEAVEDFEGAVEAAGGDLMMDEPPPGARPQPDDVRYAMPLRGHGEPVQLYLDRLARATEIVREMKTE
jgi:hypothetical protein